MSTIKKIARPTPLRGKFLLLLSMIYIANLTASILLSYRLTSFFSITLSTSIFVFPLSYFCEDIIAEVYGYKIARQVIWYGIFAMFTFAIFAKLPLLLPPKDQANALSYDHIVNPFIRICAAGAISAVVGDFLNAYTLTKWKIMTMGRLFWLRSIGSTGVGELINTVIAYFVLFSGKMPVYSILKMIAFTYCFKILYTIATVPFSAFVVYLLKRFEKIDVFDEETNFNPFRLDL